MKEEQHQKLNIQSNLSHFRDGTISIPSSPTPVIFNSSPSSSHSSPDKSGAQSPSGRLLKRKDAEKAGLLPKSHEQFSSSRTYYYRTEDVNQVIETTTRKLATDPHDPKALFVRANAYFKLQRYNDTVTDLVIALCNDPTHTEALYLRGSALSRLGEQNMAIADFTRVVRH